MEFRAFLATNIMGSFAFDKKGKILDKKLFPKDPEFIAERLSRVRKGEIIPEEEAILKNLISCGFKEVIWNKKGRKYKDIACIYIPDNIAVRKLQDEFRSLAVEFKWVVSQGEINELLSKVNILLAKGEIRKVRKDEIIMHAIGVFDEITKEVNVLSSKLKEWYGLHFPEMSNLVKNDERYAEIVYKYGKRENIKESGVESYASSSAGMDFSDEDVKEVQGLARSVSELYATKKSIEKYIETACNRIIPNMSAVAGSILAARLLSLGGGLEKIAKLPSSTIQLLGSEKALFRHMRDKERFKAPKFGVLFGHEYVQKAPDEMRGKVARLVAAKISLAAKMDFFSKEDRGEELKKELEKDIRKVIGNPLESSGHSLK